MATRTFYPYPTAPRFYNYDDDYYYYCLLYIHMHRSFTKLRRTQLKFALRDNPLSTNIVQEEQAAAPPPAASPASPAAAKKTKAQETEIAAMQQQLQQMKASAAKAKVKWSSIRILMNSYIFCL
jgi:hypothetical protein